VSELGGKVRRTVRVPFEFGERVYHRAKSEKAAGLVTGFQVRQAGLMILVTWGDDLREGIHYFYELSTDFEPFKEES
jgi:hypothetical protein